MDCTKSCSGGGANGNRYGITKTAREHNNPPALIKKQMMIEPTHNSRYNNNNNNKYMKLYTTNYKEHTHTQQTNNTRKQKQSPKNFYLYERICAWDKNVWIGVTWWGNWLMIIAHIEKHFLYLHYICIMQATCMTWNAQKQSHAQVNTQTYLHYTHIHTDTHWNASINA